MDPKVHPKTPSTLFMPLQPFNCSKCFLFCFPIWTITPTIVIWCFLHLPPFPLYVLSCDLPHFTNSRPHALVNDFDLLCVITISMFVLPSSPLSSPGLSRSIFELLFGLLRACVEDLASAAHYAPMFLTLVYLARGPGEIQVIYAYLNTLDLVHLLII